MLSPTRQEGKTQQNMTGHRTSGDVYPVYIKCGSHTFRREKNARLHRGNLSSDSKDNCRRKEVVLLKQRKLRKGTESQKQIAHYYTSSFYYKNNYMHCKNVQRVKGGITKNKGGIENS